MSQTKKLENLKQLIEAAEISLQQARNLLNEMMGRGIDSSSLGKARAQGVIKEKEGGGQVIEGVFDGQNMIGPDGKQYSVPSNYASKSKLIEGDVLKLTITQDGSFIYKQIRPIERKRIKGILTRDETTGEYRVLAEGRAYRVLMASVTYFKGEEGDEVVLLVPRDKESSWGAVENIIKKVFLPGTSVTVEEEKIEPKEKELGNNVLESRKEEESLPEDKEKIYTFPESDEIENLSPQEKSDEVGEKETDDLGLGEDEFEKI